MGFSDVTTMPYCCALAPPCFQASLRSFLISSALLAFASSSDATEEELLEGIPPSPWRAPRVDNNRTSSLTASKPSTIACKGPM